MSNCASDPQRRLILGCIADDVTGATDLALNLVQGGMGVTQVLGVPSAAELADINADAVVVALKTRSLPRHKAVEQSLAALNALLEHVVERYFFKYCSTFDSTAEGNIGPVAEALLTTLDERQTVFCPAFPNNGRTVYQGHLFVNDQLLHESGMQHHPLNPMTDANLVRFLGKQTERPVGLLDYEAVANGHVESRLSTLADEGIPLVVVDACDNAHLRQLASGIGHLRLVTGGSGIARYLPQAYRAAGLLQAPRCDPQLPNVSGRNLIIAGSCSQATQRQVDAMKTRCPAWQIDVPQLMAEPKSYCRSILEWASNTEDSQTLLIYSTAAAEQIESLQQQYGAQPVADAVEQCFAQVVPLLVKELNCRRLVLAGGETSGAVVQALGVRSLRIGPEICAGVPWTESTGEPPLALALKSGNFGDDEFFSTALEMLP